MSSPQNTEQGSSLVIALIVLFILTALGLMVADVTDINIMIAANDRDAKNALIHADSGVNVGHEILEANLEQNQPLALCNENLAGLPSCPAGTCDAACWTNQTVASFNASDNASWPISLYTNGTTGIYLRAGQFSQGLVVGSAIQMGAGYEGVGKSAAKGGSFVVYLVRSHYEGDRASRAEVDLGWRHVNY